MIVHLYQNCLKTPSNRVGLSRLTSSEKQTSLAVFAPVAREK
jgi:hypothetical protein